MLSLGAAAFSVEGGQGKLVSTFSANLDTLDGAAGDPATMKWWGTQSEAWVACRKDTLTPVIAMRRFAAWLKNLPGKPVCVCYPAGYDFTFLYWYLIKFTGQSPFSFSALDIKSYAMAVLRKSYRESTKQNMPGKWFGKKRHTHIAIDDAIEQGELFCNMLIENTGPPSRNPDRKEDG